MIVIDGSYGEGGGQVLRTSLALSAITGQPVRIEHIRAGRRKPGLMPQHLTGVRAATRVCDAQVEGARLNSLELAFAPRSAPRAGTYTFDVAQAAKGGSAGSVSLIFQTVLLPLALAEGTSELTLRGGTHVAWSPPYDYLKRVYLPTLARMGVQAKVNIRKWGWYPIGGGEVEATIHGLGRASLEAMDLSRRGDLLRVRGLSVSSNLPKHIRVRQEGAALQALRSNGVNARIDAIDAPSKGKGTAVFLWADFENAHAGFTSLGELGKPAEQVAEEAAQELVEFLQAHAALDRHLADQVVLPMALAEGRSSFTTEAVTQHLLTNAWVVNQFFSGRVRVDGQEGEPGECSIEGVGRVAAD
ncbi:MAG: RNA 3'-terminal phosphate cyclase [Anaerolineae bacterium]|nr:RNA 3'-terminal phosphate cyclase [Anaerolineae bacterium]